MLRTKSGQTIELRYFASEARIAGIVFFALAVLERDVVEVARPSEHAGCNARTRPSLDERRGFSVGLPDGSMPNFAFTSRSRLRACRTRFCLRVRSRRTASACSFSAAEMLARCSATMAAMSGAARRRPTVVWLRDFRVGW